VIEQIVEDARGVLNKLRRWLIGHIKRDANFAKNGLAKTVIK
jgi:hypothetical protein